MQNSANNANQFYFFLRFDRTCTMHTTSDNIKIMMGSKTNDITEELFRSIQKYQQRLAELT